MTRKNLIRFIVLLSFLICLVFSLFACGPVFNSSSSPAPPTPPPTPTPTPTPSNYIILVGIEDYPGIDHDLDYAVDDVNDIRQSLIDSTRWSNSTFVSITDTDATKAIIQTQVTLAASQVDENGTFLFFFSGHGTHAEDTGYLVPYDGMAINGDPIVWNMISEDNLESWLSAFPETVNKVIILDACHSGHLIGKDLPPNTTIKFFPMPGSETPYKKDFLKDITTVSNLFVMTAAAGDEECGENPGLENAIFTYYLVEGLGEGVAIGPADINESLSITCLECFNYADPLATDFNPTQHAQSYYSEGIENLVIKQ